jgi:hypothetical protein
MILNSIQWHLQKFTTTLPSFPALKYVHKTYSSKVYGGGEGWVLVGSGGFDKNFWFEAKQSNTESALDLF